MYNIYISGVEKLLEVYKNKPNFADAEAQEDSRQKSHQVRLKNSNSCQKLLILLLMCFCVCDSCYKHLD